ncbi:MAG: argininosuccinate lyase, partial [Candidatus Limnocylindria bacterium]
RAAAAGGHTRAVVLADRLVAKGIAFRDAHQRVGRLVARAEATNVDLADLPPAEMAAALPELDGAPMPSLAESVAAADVAGGTAPHRVRVALGAARERMETST